MPSDQFQLKTDYYALFYNNTPQKPGDMYTEVVNYKIKNNNIIFGFENCQSGTVIFVMIPNSFIIIHKIEF